MGIIVAVLSVLRVWIVADRTKLVLPEILLLDVFTEECVCRKLRLLIRNMLRIVNVHKLFMMDSTTLANIVK